jgi:hypothetical protein
VTEPAAVQQDLDDLLGRLQVLGIRIRELRVSLAPLEAELETARREFDERVGSLRREGLWLEHQVHLLKTPARPAAEELTAIDAGNLAEHAREMAAYRHDPETVEKDCLLEHLMRVLDPELDDQAGDLIAVVQGLANDPATRLADLLEELPWGSAWTGRPPAEDLDAQCRRLRTWKRALRRQLDTLEQARDRLRGIDPRYPLYAERQRGPDVWKAYLDRAAARQHERNLGLKAVVEELQRSRPDSGERG